MTTASSKPGLHLVAILPASLLSFFFTYFTKITQQPGVEMDKVVK
jgi:hypothetical protein